MSNKHNVIESTVHTNSYGLVVSRKKIKDNLFKDYREIGHSHSDLSKIEKNDCAVRAFMIALNLSYNESHKFASEKLNRKSLKGTYVLKYINNILGHKVNGYKLNVIGYHPSIAHGHRKKLVNPKYKKETGYTVKSFMEQYTTGRYVIIVKKHALALVDGVLYGNNGEQFHGFFRKVQYVIECK
jgi:hypothetical protein